MGSTFERSVSGRYTGRVVNSSLSTTQVIIFNTTSIKFECSGTSPPTAKFVLGALPDVTALACSKVSDTPVEW